MPCRRWTADIGGHVGEPKMADGGVHHEGEGGEGGEDGQGRTTREVDGVLEEAAAEGRTSAEGASRGGHRLARICARARVKEGSASLRHPGSFGSGVMWYDATKVMLSLSRVQ